jgi:hypothetical protein
MSISHSFSFQHCLHCKSEKLPFASRLAKFPDAWLLPLFPIMLRILYWLYASVVSAVISADLVSAASIGHTFRRLCFYIVLLNVRGWILYVLLNEVEDQFVASLMDHAPCWYNGWLQPEQKLCNGRTFDFSDHVVLYYAQILPIALIETLYAFQCPYWVADEVSALNKTPLARIPQFLLPIVLAASHLYLQFITAIGAYKTAAFFHTPGEVVAGFMVSMVVTTPLLLLQCSLHTRWSTWRVFFFR